MCYNLGGTMYHDLQRFSFHEKKINQLKVDEAYTVCNTQCLLIQSIIYRVDTVNINKVINKKLYHL
jgi:hypothetical protein